MLYYTVNKWRHVITYIPNCYITLETSDVMWQQLFQIVILHWKQATSCDNIYSKLYYFTGNKWRHVITYIPNCYITLETSDVMWYNTILVLNSNTHTRQTHLLADPTCLTNEPPTFNRTADALQEFLKCFLIKFQQANNIFY